MTAKETQKLKKGCKGDCGTDIKKKKEISKDDRKGDSKMK